MLFLHLTAKHRDVLGALIPLSRRGLNSRGQFGRVEGARKQWTMKGANVEVSFAESVLEVLNGGPMDN